ncbi:MAG: dockerin type I repeat-containing protein, partial [Ruminococcus sp.]|nr:dockerin type I repeat-containing protein [Ruminococcus sp.]
ERLRGDVDGDGDVTVMDSTYLQKSIVGISDVPALETLDLKICDLDGDGTISVKDATIIQKIVVNLE